MKIKTTIENVNNGLEEIRSSGGTVRVDGSGGSVSVQGVKARFDFEDDILTVIIDDTPFLVSDSFVEGKIREYFT